MPELLRVKGGLFLSMPHPNSDAAEACFAQSLELSRHQGKPDEGRRLLEPILQQFTEGQDTADPQAAGRLLAKLGQVQ